MISERSVPYFPYVARAPAVQAYTGESIFGTDILTLQASENEVFRNLLNSEVKCVQCFTNIVIRFSRIVIMLYRYVRVWEKAG